MIINSTNINKTNNYLSSNMNSLNRKQAKAYDIGDSGPCSRQAHTFGGVKPVYGIITVSS
jgi:hypothetical protein